MGGMEGERLPADGTTVVVGVVWVAVPVVLAFRSVMNGRNFGAEAVPNSTSDR